MPFTTADYEAIREAFSLPLAARDRIIAACTAIQRYDEQYDTEIVAKAQGYLAELATINAEIETRQDSETFGASQVQVQGEGLVSYQSGAGGGAIAGLVAKRNSVYSRLEKIFEGYLNAGYGRVFRS